MDFPTSEYENHKVKSLKCMYEGRRNGIPSEFKSVPAVNGIAVACSPLEQFPR